MITTVYDFSAVKWAAVPWQASIAQNPMDASYADYLPDGVRFTGIGSKPYAGQLWNVSLPLLPIPNRLTATLSGQLMVDDAIATNAQAIELDMMASDAQGDVGNGSGQLNINEGGIWQVIENGAWINVPNFVPTMPIPNQWTPFSVTHSFGLPGEQSEFQSVAVGVTTAVDGVPPQPYQKLGWAPNQMVIQVQLTLVNGGGCCSFKLGKLQCQVIYQ